MEKRCGHTSGQENFQYPNNSSRETPKSRFAYLGNGEVADSPPSTFGEQLWRIYGEEEVEGISDGTLRHEISRVIQGEDFYKRER